MDKRTIFNIQKFSINDGPGIRTTVFMKGCGVITRNPRAEPPRYFTMLKSVSAAGNVAYARKVVTHSKTRSISITVKSVMPAESVPGCVIPMH